MKLEQKKKAVGIAERAAKYPSAALRVLPVRHSCRSTANFHISVSGTPFLWLSPPSRTNSAQCRWPM